MTTQLARHDHHNVELKTFFDPKGLGFEGWLELYLFVPGSFQLSQWDKKDLHADLRPRTRVSMPPPTHDGHLSLLTAFKNLEDSSSDGEIDFTIENAQHAGSVLYETLRSWSTSQQAVLSKTLEPETAPQQACLLLKNLHADILLNKQILFQARDILDSSHPETSPVIGLLREYLNTLYSKYLSDLETALSSLHTCSAPEISAMYPALEQTLEKLRYDQATWMCMHSIPSFEQLSEQERENYLIRLSLLKKFFQSKMFVEVSALPKKNHIAETWAIIGTAIAGLCSALAQRFFQPTNDELAWSGAFVIFLGVLLYTLRDRIKDRLKASLTKRAFSQLADKEHMLSMNGSVIGKCKEWCSLSRTKNLPKKIQELRHKANLGQFEKTLGKTLPEETLIWKRWHCIPSALKMKETSLAIQENIRINLERYLKYMDDPYKELALLDNSGKFTLFKSKRLYHFHIAIRSQFGTPNSTVVPNEKIFRVVLNKKGIERIEQIPVYLS